MPRCSSGRRHGGDGVARGRAYSGRVGSAAAAQISQLRRRNLGTCKEADELIERDKRHWNNTKAGR